MTTDPEHDRSRLPLVFGWVSLLQDLGSKMVAPVIPLLLAGPLGAGPLVVGVVDAAGDATASLTKAVGGRLADRGRALPLVRFGYLTSSLAKAAIAVATVWPAVLALRLVDRVGKGVRDAPRDLMLAGTAAGRRGNAFGIQQAMDKTGGFLGPLLGALVHQLTDESLRAIFVVALVPCLASVVVLHVALGADDEPAQASTSTRSAGKRASAPLAPRTRRALAILGVHGAATLPAGLLILRANDLGMSVGAVLLAYSCNRAVIAVCALPAGRLADRFGARPVVVCGMGAHAISLACLAIATAPPLALVGLAIAGAGDALVRGPTKVLLSDLAADGERGRVLGDHGAIVGMAGLAGAAGAGLAWTHAPWVFAAAAGITAVAGVAILVDRDSGGGSAAPGSVDRAAAH